MATFVPEEAPELHSHVDFIVCLGGDGLLLHAATLFGSAMPPIVSFKLGSLGFLTAHRYADFKAGLADVVYGCSELETCQVSTTGARAAGAAGWGLGPSWAAPDLPNPPPTNPPCQVLDSTTGEPKKGVNITLRMRLECELWRCVAACVRAGAAAGGFWLVPRCSKSLPDPAPPAPLPRQHSDGKPLPGAEQLEVLNEVVISRGSNPYLSNIEVRGGRSWHKTCEPCTLIPPSFQPVQSLLAGAVPAHPSCRRCPAAYLAPYHPRRCTSGGGSSQRCRRTA